MSQPPRGERAGTSRGKDRFRRDVAYAIVIVSIVGAVVSWRASEESQTAGGKTQQATQERLLAEQARATNRGWVQQDLRLVASLQELETRQRTLKADARAVRRSNPRLADDLRAQAERAGLEFSTLNRYVLVSDAVSTENGRTTYRRALANRLLETDNGASVRPTQTRREAADARAKSVRLLAAAAALAAALFWMTLAQLARPRPRRAFAAIGGTFAAVGLLTAFLVAVL